MRTSLLSSSFKRLVKPDYQHWEGVPKINIYCLRFLYTLMFVFLGKDAWTYIFTNTEVWEPRNAMAWSVWASFSLLALLGIFRPLKMLPILLLEISYKVIWLLLVAYPLWQAGKLAGSPAEGMTVVFLPVFLPILFVPWRYVWRTYVLGAKPSIGVQSHSLL